MKKRFICAFAICLILILLTGCTTHSKKVPTEGIWYCDELQISMDFDTDRNTFAVIDDTKITCCILNDRGSSYVSVLYQDFKHKLPRYNMGSTVFAGECQSLNANCLYIEDDEGNVYHFVRVYDVESLKEYS